MKNSGFRSILVGATIGLMIFPLAGCAKKTASLDSAEQITRVDDTVNAASSAQAPTGTSATTTGTNAGAGPAEPLDTPPPDQSAHSGTTGTAESVEGSRTSLGFRPVYFDFDKSTIRPDQVERVRANAQYLKNNPAIKARIEGNCDERGTYVYNLALGEVRATSAKKYLINLGVTEDRLTTLSYGEERPVNPGQEEIPWAQNRRDDFVSIQ